MVDRGDLRLNGLDLPECPRLNQQVIAEEVVGAATACFMGTHRFAFDLDIQLRAFTRHRNYRQFDTR
jgi:hypothetical protein